MAHRSRPTSDRRHCETCQPISEARRCASRQADTRSRFHTRSCRQATLVSDPIFHPSSPSVRLPLSVLPPSPVPTCILLAGGGPSRLPAARATKAQVEVEVDIRQGQGGYGRGVGVRTWPMYSRIHSRSDPPPPSSYLVIFCCHSCTAPSSTVPCQWLLPPVHRSSPCIFISNRSRLHHPHPCLFSCLPVPASLFHILLASRLLSSSFPCLFFSLSFPFLFFIFLFS